MLLNGVRNSLFRRGIVNTGTELYYGLRTSPDEFSSLLMVGQPFQYKKEKRSILKKRNDLSHSSLLNLKRFSTSGSGKNFVGFSTNGLSIPLILTRLGAKWFILMVIRKYLDKDFKPEDFCEASLIAINKVCTLLSRYEIEPLRDVLSPDIFKNVQEDFHKLPPEDIRLLIPAAHECNINFCTFDIENFSSGTPENETGCNIVAQIFASVLSEKGFSFYSFVFKRRINKDCKYPWMIHELSMFYTKAVITKDF